jgi:hypothetical protein
MGGVRFRWSAMRLTPCSRTPVCVKNWCKTEMAASNNSLFAFGADWSPSLVLVRDASAVCYELRRREVLHCVTDDGLDRCRKRN